MGWAFIAITPELRRRAIAIVAVALIAILFAIAGYLGVRDTACDPPDIEEAAEAYLLDHPECVDGGAR